MELEREIEAMRLLERALDVPRAQRMQWLDEQAVSESVRERVLALLESAEREAGEVGFMQAPPASAASVAAPDLPNAGDRLGSWQLLRELDAGGMGVVFLARRADDAYEQLAAVKLVRAGLSLLDTRHRAELIARFENERRVLARLDHRNVARILDGGRTDAGVPYLVMEYVDGPTLADYCDRQHLDVGARLALFAKVCDGVQAAHRHLIVHRDLKPQNILVGADGEPRLLDFGIARVLESEADGDAAARTELSAMTPAYASPEQLRREPPTTASDVYSLGVVLYELLAGVRPYRLDGLSPAQSERVVCETPSPPLRKALADSKLSAAEQRARAGRIGGELERIIAKALHKDPERRYGSAEALADDLRRHLDGRPVTAQGDTGWYRARKFLARHRLASTAAALALAAVIAAGGVAFWQAGQARRAVADAERINQYLTDVLASADAYVAGEEMTLNEALGDAAARIDARFAGRPDLASGLRLAIGNSLANRYRLDEAQVQLERGLAESTHAFGAADLRTLKLREAVALLRSYQGRTREAITLFEALIAQLEDDSRTGEPFYAIALNDLAHIYLNEEDYEPAFAYARRAADTFERRGVGVPDEDRASILSNLAQALDGLGRSQEAVEPYERALVLQRGLFPDGSPNEAILLNNLALLQRSLGDRERSLALLQDSARMRQRVLEPDHPLIVRGLTNVARQALELERWPLALEAAQEAVATADRAFGQPHAHQVLAVAALADAQWRTGAPSDAAATLQRATMLMAALPEPNANTTTYIGEVRARVCANGNGAVREFCKAP